MCSRTTAGSFTEANNWRADKGHHAIVLLDFLDCSIHDLDAHARAGTGDFSPGGTFGAQGCVHKKALETTERQMEYTG